MIRHARVYSALLRVYPARFRHDYGEEMTRLFGEQVRIGRRRPAGFSGVHPSGDAAHPARTGGDPDHRELGHVSPTPHQPKVR